uniref:Uncharacterized protein n=1 Tax=Arundo donax TaxID=35708 RepID=A0A0A9D915_ARUDO
MGTRTSFCTAATTSSPPSTTCCCCAMRQPGRRSRRWMVAAWSERATRAPRGYRLGGTFGDRIWEKISQEQIAVPLRVDEAKESFADRPVEERQTEEFLSVLEAHDAAMGVEVLQPRPLLPETRPLETLWPQLVNS